MGTLDYEILSLPDRTDPQSRYISYLFILLSRNNSLIIKHFLMTNNVFEGSIFRLLTFISKKITHSNFIEKKKK